MRIFRLQQAYTPLFYIVQKKTADLMKQISTEQTSNTWHWIKRNPCETVFTRVSSVLIID